jgi:signal transduction histidine kinase
VSRYRAVAETTTSGDVLVVLAIPLDDVDATLSWLLRLELVDDLLLLARLDQGRPLERRPVDLEALVHTPAGTRVEVALRPEGDRAVLEVIDPGNGILAGQAERIFDFHRVAAGRSADQGGSGLGLSIVAAVVQAHGGRIRVLDTRGGGATFRIELALADGPSRLSAFSRQTPRVG